MTATPGYLDLLGLHASALFRLDGDGCLASLNERTGGRAPLAYVAHCAEGAILLAREPALRARLEAALAVLPAWRAGEPSGLLAWLRETVGGAIERTWEGPVFRFALPAFALAGALQLFPGNAGLLHPDLATLGPELPHRRPAFAVIRDRQAVAVCYTSRGTGKAAEAGVETAPAYRGQGCAGVAVEAWSAAVREAGCVPFYSTSWGNTASLAVARKIELEPFAEEAWIA